MPAAALDEVLRTIRERGSIGTTIDEAVAHSRRFVERLPIDCSTLVDLGSGGGLPGLVIAVDRPAIQVVLVERRESRADLLRRAVHALGVHDRVAVHGADVRLLAATAATFDAVTARSFARPEVTLRWAAALCAPGGLTLISEPPFGDDADRWPAALLSSRGFDDEGLEQGIRCLRRRFT
jgi:16S rRNA (guanine527-N7)-methyltransferase